MGAHTVLRVRLQNYEQHEVVCLPGVEVQHMPHHLMMVQDAANVRHVWNFERVEWYTLTEVPATPAEGS